MTKNSELQKENFMTDQNLQNIESLNNFLKFSFDQLSELKEIQLNKTYDLVQKRLVFQNTKVEGDKSITQVSKNEDKFSFELRSNFFDSKNKSLIIVCLRDNASLLDFVLSKTIVSSKNNDCDILVVDDRSKDDSVFQVSQKYGASCLRCENSSNIFSYSTLNNIAVKIADVFNKETCIFWNCDMWPSDEETLGRLMSKHFKSGATLSGTRLVYPPVEDFQKLFPNVNHYFGEYSRIAGRIQHGGMIYGKLPSPFADHQWRFYQKNHGLACVDTFVPSVTGAFWIISTKDFIEIGGLNPSLVSLCQDNDFCLKLLQAGKTVFYIGSEFLYHAESIFQQQHKVSHEVQNGDGNLYNQIWSPKILNLLGLQPIN